MGTAPLRYQSERVILLVHPRNTMTWELWGEHLKGLEAWFRKYAFVECDLDFGEQGVRKFTGWGVLVQIDRGVGVQTE